MFLSGCGGVLKERKLRSRGYRLMNKKRLKLKIHGEVQGVSFRYAVKQLADSLGLSGWVRNSPDGSVEAVFEGGEAELGKMLEWCWQGPVGAKVVNIEEDWQDKLEDRYHGFEIRL